MSVKLRRSRREPMKPAGETPDLARQIFGRTPEHTVALLRAAWPAAVGPELARRTEVLALDGRTLRVRVPDKRWMSVLHRMRRDILDRLRRTAGSLAPTGLGFHEGAPTTEPERTAPVTHPDAEEAPAPAALREAAAVIEDDELRERFMATAARYLQRQSQEADDRA
jgi:hypothetical protein